VTTDFTADFQVTSAPQRLSAYWIRADAALSVVVVLLLLLFEPHPAATASAAHATPAATLVSKLRTVAPVVGAGTCRRSAAAAVRRITRRG
jgi:hypothetical protein